MTIDDILHRAFGTTDLAAVTSSGLEAGIERLTVDLGLASDREQRFALWSLLYTLGSAPDLDVAFPDPADRDAARNLMDLMAAAGGD